MAIDGVQPKATQQTLFGKPEVKPISRWSVDGLRKEIAATGSEAAKRYIGLAIGVLQADLEASRNFQNTQELQTASINAIESWLRTAHEVSIADQLEEEDRQLLDFSWIAALADRNGRKFVDADLENSRELIQAANWYVREGYVPSKPPFSFMENMVTAYKEQGRLHLAQLRGVLNCLVAVVRKEERTKTTTKNIESGVRGYNSGSRDLTPEEIEYNAKVVKSVVQPQVKRGRYTIILGDKPDGSHDTITIRLENAKQNPRFPRPQGSQIASFLANADYDGVSGYCGFATVVGEAIDVWPKTNPNGRPMQALSILLHGGLEASRKAGEKYALESKNCYVCGKPLVVEDSILSGIGPICASYGY
jgi:hypothetical protein